MQLAIPTASCYHNFVNGCCWLSRLDEEKFSKFIKLVRERD
jgi:hypothetical protein